MKIARETWLLGLICLADMISTLLLVHSGAAVEANPVLSFFLDRGGVWFVIAKSLLFLGPLFVLELLRRRRPESVTRILRVGIVLYLVCYGIGAVHVNVLNAMPLR